jgi:uncharacterized RDD family membrane protein YckC
VVSAETGGSRHLLSGTVAATDVHEREIAFIDAVVPGILILTALLIAVVNRTAPGYSAAGIVTCLLLMVAYVAVSVFALGRYGRTLGRFVLGLRTVDDITATPITVQRLVRDALARRWLSGTLTCDIRHGRDPVSAAFAEVPANALVAFSRDPILTAPQHEGAEQHPSAAAGIDETTLSRAQLPTAKPHDHPGLHSDVEPSDTSAQATTADLELTVVLDSGQRFELAPCALIGRNPAAGSGGAECAIVAIADLSRTLSKTHALLEWDGKELWVTDVGSSNGTGIIGPDGQLFALEPLSRTPVPPDWTVAPGERSLTFRVGERQGA